MGFFSSIGNFVSSIAKPVTSLVGGILGNKSQSNAQASNQAFANEQFQFQKDYIQNQLQWKVEDAKKAGLHPMAVIGMQSPSFSPVSTSNSGLDYSWIGDLGQSANYGATKAKSTPEQKQMVNLQIRGMELDNEYKQAQIDQMKVDTLASSIASNQAFNSPPAPEVNLKTPPEMPKPPKAEDLFTFVLDGKGKKTRLYPTDFMTSAWEDRPAGSSLAPLAEAEKLEQDAKMRGTVILGHVWSRDDEEFVPVNSAAGKRALDLWKRIGSASRFERYMLKYPKEKMNSIDRAFFDWVNRVFN